MTSYYYPPKGSGGGGSGTVTSVGLSLPVEFTVTGSPVTTSGTLTATWADEMANTVFAGPASGPDATPTFRALVAADLPALGGIAWLLAGNASTSPGTDFIGTTDSQALIFKTNNAEHLQITTAGEIVTTGNLIVDTFPIGTDLDAVFINNASAPQIGNLRMLNAANNQDVGGNYAGLFSSNGGAITGNFSAIEQINIGDVTGGYEGIGDHNNGDIGGDYDGLLSGNVGDVTGNARSLNINFNGNSDNYTAVAINIQGTTRTGGEQAISVGMSNADTTGKILLSGIMGGGTHTGGGRFMELNAQNGVYTNWIGLNLNHGSIDPGGNETGLNIGKSTVDSIDYIGINFPSNGPSGSSFTGINLSSSPTATTVSYRGISVNPNSSFTSTNAQGIDVNMTNVTITGSEPKSYSSSGGKLDFQSNATIRTGTGFSSGNNIAMNTITAGDVTGTDFVGNNLLTTFDITDNIDAGSIGLGLNMVGYIGSMQIAAAKTVARINGVICGAGTAGTGTLTNFSGYVAAPPFPSTMTIDNYRAFEVLPGFTSGATNNWGVTIRDANLNNWMAKNLVIGGSTGLPTGTDQLDVTGSAKIVNVGTDSDIYGTISEADVHATQDGAYGAIGVNAIATARVDATFTDNKFASGTLNTVSRGDGTDDGTLVGISGVLNLLTLNSGTGGVTDTGYGVANILTATQGTLTDYYDIFCQRSGSATVTNHYGLYLSHDSTTPIKNWMSGSTRFGGTSFVAPTETIDVTGSVRTDTSLILEDPGAGTDAITIQSPTLSAPWTLTLPVDAGTNTYVLQTNGSGVTSWVAQSGGSTPLVAFKAMSDTPTTASFTSGTDTVIFPSLGTFGFDTDSAYNSTTGIYTIPTTGTYRVTGAVSIVSNYQIGFEADVVVYINGVLAAESTHRAWSTTSQPLQPLVTAIFELTAGDQVYLVAITNTGSGTSFAANEIVNYFEVSAITTAAVMASPLTTKGDIFTYNGINARLPVGTDGQILSANSATSTGLEWIAAPVTGATTALDNLASTQINTDLVFAAAGTGVNIKEGSNAKMGVATLSGGSVAVSTTAVTANSRIFLTNNNPAGIMLGFLWIPSRTPGTGFTIFSSSGTDNSDIAWLIMEPA